MNNKLFRVILSVVSLILLFIVILSLPCSATTPGVAANLYNKSSFAAPATVIFNYTVNSFYNPLSYISSYSMAPLVPNLYQQPDESSPDLNNYVIYSDSNATNYDDGQGVNTYASIGYSRYVFLPDYSDYTITESYDLNGTAVFSYHIHNDDDMDSMVDSRFTSIVIEDFYCWNTDYYERDCEVSFMITDFTDSYSVSSIDISYRAAGDTELVSLTLSGSDIPASIARGEFNLSPRQIDGNTLEYLVYYIDNITIHIADNTSHSPTRTLSGQVAYTYYPGLVEYDIQRGQPFDPDSNPAFPLLGYTEWLGNAASGFLDLEIFPNFTLGGLLMTLIAFLCAMWFLKIFAGG